MEKSQRKLTFKKKLWCTKTIDPFYFKVVIILRKLVKTNVFQKSKALTANNIKDLAKIDNVIPHVMKP